MHAAILRHQDALIALCRHHGVARLAVFGSAARGADFDPDRSDVDLLVEFAPSTPRSFAGLLALQEAAAALLARSVDLMDQRALDESDNYIRRRQILAEAQPLYIA